jgi:hypothetical protein
MPMLVHVPPGSVDQSAQANPAGSALASTVIG